MTSNPLFKCLGIDVWEDGEWYLYDDFVMASLIEFVDLPEQPPIPEAPKKEAEKHGK